MNARTDTNAIASAESHERLVDRYIACWNESDPARRRELIAQAWAPDARYVDPLMRGEGHAAIAELVRAVQAQFPGHRFIRIGSVDAHAGGIGFTWELAHPQAGTFARGTDFAELDGEGRLSRVTGFLDGTPGQPPADPAQPASKPSNGQQEVRWGVERFARFWAAPDLTRPSNELAPDVEGWWPGMTRPLRGVADYTRPLRKLLERVPDFRLEVAEHATNGDFVFIRWIAQGTDRGEPLRFTGVDRIRQKNGQVVENRIFCDHPLVRSLVSDEAAG